MIFRQPSAMPVKRSNFRFIQVGEYSGLKSRLEAFGLDQNDRIAVDNKAKPCI